VRPIKRTPEFDRWFREIRDSLTRIRLARRLDKFQRGVPGDVGPVGGGVFEMREHFGPGWRMCYLPKSESLIVMLGGGCKSTQQADIKATIQSAPTLEE
jgi:putative addiction module killer protein